MIKTVITSIKTFFSELTIQKLVGWGLALILGACVTFGILQMLKPDPYDPLGPYPEQQIITLLNETTPSGNNKNVIIPLINVDSKYVFSQATKCSDETTKVQGRLGWRSTVPGGFTYDSPPRDPGQRIKGCQSFTFQNTIPREVYDWAKRVLANGQQPEIYISGCETPIKKDGTEGVTLCWRTQPFAFKQDAK